MKLEKKLEKQEASTNSYARLNLKIQLRNLVKSKSKFVINTFCIFLASLFSLFSGVVPIALDSFKNGELNSTAPFYSEVNYAPYNNNQYTNELSKYFNPYGYYSYDNHGTYSDPSALNKLSANWSDSTTNFSPVFKSQLIGSTNFENANFDNNYLGSVLDYWEKQGSIGNKYPGYNDYSQLLNNPSTPDATKKEIAAGINKQAVAAASVPVAITAMFVTEQGISGFFLNAYLIASLLKVEAFLAREMELSANVDYWKNQRTCPNGYINDNWACYDPINKAIDLTNHPNPYFASLYSDLAVATPNVEKIIISALGSNPTAQAFFSKWNSPGDILPSLVDEIEKHQSDPLNRKSLDPTRGLGGLLVGIASYFAPYNVLIQVKDMQNNVLNLINNWDGTTDFPDISSVTSNSKFYLTFGSLVYNDKVNELFTKIPQVTVSSSAGSVSTNIYGLNQDSKFWDDSNKKEALNNLVTSGAYAQETLVDSNNHNILSSLPGPWNNGQAVPVVVNESFYRQFPEVYKIGTTKGLTLNYTSKVGETTGLAQSQVKIIGYIKNTFGPSNIFTSRQEANALGFTSNSTQNTQGQGCAYYGGDNKMPDPEGVPTALPTGGNPFSYSYCHIFSTNSVNITNPNKQYYYPAQGHEQANIDPSSPAYGDGKGYFNSIFSTSLDILDLDGLMLASNGYNQSTFGDLIGAQVNVVPGGIKKAVIDNTVIILSLILYGIIVIFIAISLIAFFLSARLIIDENKVSIAMMRTLGFKKREILTKTLGGFFILTLTIFLIVVPIAYILSKALLVTVISKIVSTTDYIHIGFNPWIFVIAIGTLCVFLSAVIFVALRGIGKVDIIKILNA